MMICNKISRFFSDFKHFFRLFRKEYFFLKMKFLLFYCKYQCNQTYLNIKRVRVRRNNDDIGFLEFFLKIKKKLIFFGE